MRKLITVIFFIASSLIAQNPFKIIPPEEAFHITFTQQESFVYVDIKMEEGVYLLEDKLIFETLSPKRFNFTDTISALPAEIYKEQKVHFNSYETAISLEYLRAQKISGKTKISVTYQGCAEGGVICYPPMSAVYEVNIKTSYGSQQGAIAEMFQDKSFFFILASFFGFGLLLSLTPCTFPMVPIVSSIIASYGKKDMNAKKGFWLSFVYVFFMSVAYTIAGVIAGLFGSNVQVALQNPWAIGVFSAIFVLLALSMFGLFSFGLPSSLQSRFSTFTKGKKGVVGIAVMGFFSALIVGPCVAAPLVGALMYIGQSGDAFLGGTALFVMSMAMGVPLLLVGASAGRFLPKPGIWMRRVQRIFGFIMLGVAVWIGSRVLSENVSLMLYAVLLICFGAYVFTFKLFTPFWRRAFKVSAVLVSVYGVILFFGGLNGGGGLLSPVDNFSREKVKKSPVNFTEVKNLETLDREIANAKKPVMLEFTASWCAVCSEFEDKTLSQKSVQERLLGFVLLRADVTKNSDEDKELMRRFGLYGPPSIVFFKNGSELEGLQIVGFKNEQDFLAHLDMVENE
ncbi:MAG: protein-disulfide reductase DsbD [Campylobacteraceae bacterium]|nr:protein-disulfide reductase DsbD [Campylobacteraceae bacterium]